jgi:hypothetical protein
MRIFQLMAYLIEQPALGLVPGIALLGLHHLSRSRFVLAVALLWVCYVPYEFGMKLRILCSGECNIRVDLLLIYPCLALLSAAAAVVAVRKVLAQRRSEK